MCTLGLMFLKAALFSEKHFKLYAVLSECFLMPHLPSWTFCPIIFIGFYENLVQQ